jgi:Regulator of chromosome condensation (RCC1) repeat/Putative Ig domain
MTKRIHEADSFVTSPSCLPRRQSASPRALTWAGFVLAACACSGPGVVQAPTALEYAPNPAIYTLGRTIEPNQPSASGGAPTAWGVAPELPAGLDFDTATGVVSGTPTVLAQARDYEVTASNEGGSVSSILSLAVLDLAPSGLSYAQNPAMWLTGQPIVPNVPTSDGGRVASYRVTPALPAGLTLDPVSGVISGSPTQVSAQAPYLVTAENSGGETTATLSVGTRAARSRTLLGSGELHACAIVDGGVRCWGWNQTGQLGNGSTADSATPVAVIGLDGGAQAVTAGKGHSCALVNGGVYCWGWNVYGELGQGPSLNLSSTPLPVPGLSSGVEAISAGFTHTCALKSGEVWCWGGKGPGWATSGAPERVGQVSAPAQALSTGGIRQTCALTGGAAQCFTYSYLGTSLPAPVSGLSSAVAAVALGQQHACALQQGAVRCWGDNTFGQLGDGTTTNRAQLVDVVGLPPDVEALAGGSGARSCALASGTVWCWGDGEGLRDAGAGSVPLTRAEQVPGLPPSVDSISCGFRHCCAAAGGRVWCWGVLATGAYYGPAAIVP